MHTACEVNVGDNVVTTHHSNTCSAITSQLIMDKRGWTLFLTILVYRNFSLAVVWTIASNLVDRTGALFLRARNTYLRRHERMVEAIGEHNLSIVGNWEGNRPSR